MKPRAKAKIKVEGLVPVKQRMKTTPLTKLEKKIVDKYMPIKSDMDLAIELGRTERQIARYRQQYLIQHSDVSMKVKDRNAAIDELHAQADWDSFKRQFSREELITFEQTYAEMMGQFKEVNYTEKEQIYSFINTKIFLQRHGIERMKCQKDMDRIERLLQTEHEKGQDYITAHAEMIMALEQELAAMRNASNSKTREYKDLMDKSQAILKDLKGTREQRIKKAEDSKHNILGLMKFLDEEDNRRAVGVEMMLADAAATVEKGRLIQFHTYMDKSVDKPLLTPDDDELLYSGKAAELDLDLDDTTNNGE